MAWKYLNPGDYRFLNNYTANTMSNVVDKTLSPVTGLAFSSDSAPFYPILIPEGTKEIWCAFTIFTLHTNYGSYGNAPNVSLNGSSSLNSKLVRLYVGVTYCVLNIDNYAVLNPYFYSFSSLKRVWLHVKSSSVSDGMVELFINKVKVYSQTNINIMGGDDIVCYRFYSNNTSYFLSDIIFSDEPIDLDEHVVVLPIATTITDGWTYDAVNNLYTADSAGKTIWQVPDINQLKAVTGLDNPSVTAVAVQAYNVSTNDTSQVDTLQKSVKQNGQTVITDSADISSATAVISPAMTINPVTNTAWTLNDLSNLQLGITTAKSA